MTPSPSDIETVRSFGRFHKRYRERTGIGSSSADFMVLHELLQQSVSDHPPSDLPSGATHGQGLTVRSLCRRLGIPRSQLLDIVQHQLDPGHLRHMPSASDRDLDVIALTKEVTRDRYERLNRRANERVASALMLLTPDELRDVTHAMWTIERILGGRVSSLVPVAGRRASAPAMKRTSGPSPATTDPIATLVRSVLLGVSSQHSASPEASCKPPRRPGRGRRACARNASLPGVSKPVGVSLNAAGGRNRASSADSYMLPSNSSSSTSKLASDGVVDEVE